MYSNTLQNSMALLLIKEMLLFQHHLFSCCFHCLQVKEINTVFLYGVFDDDTIFKVPFSMNQVTGSLTGEALS